MKPTPTKRKNSKETEWGKRGGVTLPEAMYEFVTGEAENRKMPVYELVFKAVEFYARAFPVTGGNHDRQA